MNSTRESLAASLRPRGTLLMAMTTYASPWPDLSLPWSDTRDTLQLWTQIVGKVRLALAPMVNHWWQVPLYVSARGLTTSLMHWRGRGVELELDFVDHALIVRSSDGEIRRVALEPRTVASFFDATVAALADLDVHVQMLARPVELEEAIPFADDVVHRAYDPVAAQRFWQALVQVHRVMTMFRGDFVGKASPVHFFWGAADLAVSRFSGRPAPKHPGGVPNCADWVQELAYSHEVSSCGFWPGIRGEGAFYSYAYPEPVGFGEYRIEPDAAYYDPELGEFLLPYVAVREAADPDATLLAFFQSSYNAAADLGAWPRAVLETAGWPPQAREQLDGG